MLAVNYRRLKSWGGTPIEQKLNDLVDAVQANSINNGVGYSVASSPNGSYLKLSPQQSALNYPFQLIDASIVSGDTTTYNLRVTYGQVLAFVNGSGGQVLVTPSGFSPGDSPQFILSGLSANTNGTVNLRVTTDSSTYQVNLAQTLPGISYETSTPTNSTFVGNISLGSLNIPSSGAMTISQGIRGVVGYINALGEHVWY